MIGPLKPEWYGIPFGVSADGKKVPIARWQADLMIYQRHREEPYVQYASAFKKPISEHFLQACRDLFTPKQVRLHSWFAEAAHAYSENEELVLLGAGSCGKSYFMGYVVTLELLIAIGDFYASLVSTDKGTLMLRSFAAALECLNNLKANGIQVPLKYVGQKCAIVPEAASEDLQNTVSMIRGVAIAEGSEQDAKRSLLGIHRPRVRSVADEIENMGSRAGAFLAAQANARAGAIDYKCVVAFNPQNINSPGCLMAAPAIPGGWTGLNPDTDMSWRTKEGRRVLRFDGLQSPGLKDPINLHFLPTKTFIDGVLKTCGGNTDHPEFWSQVRGFPPLNRPEGTVLSDAEVLAFKMAEDMEWRGDSSFVTIGGLDPAFTSGGDDCALVVADVGYRTDGMLTIKYREPIKLKLEASSPVPMSYQIVEQLRTLLVDLDIKMQNLAIDDSGTQSIADIVAKEIGGGFLRVNFGEKASDVAVSIADATPANKKYGNLVTEIWMAVAEFGRYNQIRKMPQEAVAQFTKRRFNPRRPKPKILETKPEFKARTGLGSPDVGDGCALCAAVARFVLGVKPGASLIDPGGRVVKSATVDPSWMAGVNNLRSSYGTRQPI